MISIRGKERNHPSEQGEKHARCATFIGGNGKSCPSVQRGKSKKTWRLFL